MRPLNYNLLKALICVICGIVFAVFLVLVLSQIGHNATNHVEVVQKTRLAKDVLKDLKATVKSIDGCGEKDQGKKPGKGDNGIPSSNNVTGTNSTPEAVNGTDSNPTIVTKPIPFPKNVTGLDSHPNFVTDPNAEPNIEPIEEVAQNHQIEPTENHYKIPKTKIDPIENLGHKKSSN